MMIVFHNFIISVVAVIFCSFFGICFCSESFHGGTFLAMAGKDSIIIASDSRFSSYQTGPFLLGQFPRCMYRIGSKTLIGFYGLDSDAHFIMDNMREIFSDQCDDDTDAKNIARALSDTLYSSGLQCSPIIVGFLSDGSPHICSMDGLGAQTISNSFAVSGTANSGLYAICESKYQPNLSSNKLITIVEKCLRLALQRDVLSGCGIRILTITKDGIYSKEIEIADV